MLFSLRSSDLDNEENGGLDKDRNGDEDYLDSEQKDVFANWNRHTSYGILISTLVVSLEVVHRLSTQKR